MEKEEKTLAPRRELINFPSSVTIYFIKRLCTLHTREVQEYAVLVLADIGRCSHSFDIWLSSAIGFGLHIQMANECSD